MGAGVPIESMESRLAQLELPATTAGQDHVPPTSSSFYGVVNASYC